jgi:hypothetical protein
MEEEKEERGKEDAKKSTYVVAGKTTTRITDKTTKILVKAQSRKEFAYNEGNSKLTFFVFIPFLLNIL